MTPDDFTIRRIAARPLEVPLVTPFVIATGRVDVTPNVLVEVEVQRGDGAVVTGLGESAPLPPVTRETQHDVLASFRAARVALEGASCPPLERLGVWIDSCFRDAPVARAGFETALVDALSRLADQSASAWLDEQVASGHAAPPTPSRTLTTDITIPIASVADAVALATRFYADGFRVLKVKVGLDVDDDLRVLRALAAACPGARLRLDANAALDARTALRLLDGARNTGLTIECFEQPCRREDLVGMAEVTRHGGAPVVADESVRDEADLDAVLSARAAHGINLKLVKHGGPLRALALGRRARREGLSLMAGAMVETRLGLSAMAHVVAALDGVDFVDLDTAFLLAADPFDGGYEARGPELRLTGGPGLGVRSR